MEAYAEFLNAVFARYRSGAQRAAGAAQRGASTLAQTTTGWWARRTGRQEPRRARRRGASEEATFPIPGYDEMNVQEISERLDPLTEDQIRQLKDHERENHNRKTLIERYDAKLRASS